MQGAIRRRRRNNDNEIRRERKKKKVETKRNQEESAREDIFYSTLYNKTTQVAMNKVKFDFSFASFCLLSVAPPTHITRKSTRSHRHDE